MDQKQKKLNQSKEDIELLEGLQIKEIMYGQEWHRLRRMIKNKKQDVKQMEINHARIKTKLG